MIEAALILRIASTCSLLALTGAIVYYKKNKHKGEDENDR